jgi:thiol:disulfide interchange protein
MRGRARIGRAVESLRNVAARYERLIWIGAFAAVVLIQWPMFKGLYYRAAGTPAPPTAIAWRTDLDGALEEAGRAHKQVLVDFSADWCPPCIAMTHDVWPDPAVERALAASYVPLLIDVDRNGPVAERYGVRGIPTVLVLDHTGRVVRRATFLSVLSASAMVAFLTDTE